jgi:hypothetical protein
MAHKTFLWKIQGFWKITLLIQWQRRTIFVNASSRRFGITKCLNSSRYTFTLPQQIARGELRPLRNPAALDD